MSAADTLHRPLAVILLSGGMDSAVAAAMAGRTYRLAALHVTYGQRTARRERVCFDALARHLHAEDTLTVDLDHLSRIGGSALTDPRIAVPDTQPAADAVPVTYVPFRNAHLLAVAVSWAEVIGARAVVIGAVEEDSSGYPDCRREFYQAYDEVIAHGTRPETRIRVLTPVIEMSKSEIVRTGRELQVPFHLTWSCYRNDSAACGRCDSCRLRLAGFAGAGAADPLLYAGRDASAGGLTGDPAADGDVPAASAPDAMPSTGHELPGAESDDNSSARHHGVRVPDAGSRERLVRRLESFLARVRRS